MKVLLISPFKGVVGGISMWTGHILNYMKDEKEVEVELCDFSRIKAGQLIKNPIKKWLVAITAYWKLTQKAIQQIKAFDGEVVHLCSSASLLLIKDLMILKASKGKGVRSYVHFHFGRIPQLAKANNWEWKMLKRVVELADKTIVMDGQSYKVLHQLGYNSVELLPNPLAENVKTTIDNLNMVKRERLLLFAGHCIPTKGVYELVTACKQIQNIKLKMVGAVSDEMRQKLLEMAGVHNEWLEIMGQMPFEDTLRQMKSCGIFVLPTYTEGFPNVMLESMACGCAIVASGVGAIPEMLEEENGKHFGVVIEPQSVEQLKEAIERLLNNRNLRDECGRNAKVRVNSRYNIETVCKQLTKIWQQ